jgi:hypothetical protein
MGGAIELEMVKPVSQSYLTSLWNQEAFRKDKADTLNAITNAYSQRFTKVIIAIAIGAAAFWAFVDPAKSLNAFTAVLIVACPCALALAAPFALGTAQRVLGRHKLYLKNPYVLETLANVDAIVFDKTGTLTAAGAGSVAWHGAPRALALLDDPALDPSARGAHRRGDCRTTFPRAGAVVPRNHRLRRRRQRGGTRSLAWLGDMAGITRRAEHGVHAA